MEVKDRYFGENITQLKDIDGDLIKDYNGFVGGNYWRIDAKSMSFKIGFICKNTTGGITPAAINIAYSFWHRGFITQVQVGDTISTSHNTDPIRINDLIKITDPNWDCMLIDSTESTMNPVSFVTEILEFQFAQILNDIITHNGFGLIPPGFSLVDLKFFRPDINGDSAVREYLYIIMACYKEIYDDTFSPDLALSRLKDETKEFAELLQSHLINVDKDNMLFFTVGGSALFITNISAKTITNRVELKAFMYSETLLRDVIRSVVIDAVADIKGTALGTDADFVNISDLLKKEFLAINSQKK